MNSLKYWRRELQISQYELADLAETKRYRIQLFEQGLLALDEEELARIASALGLVLEASGRFSRIAQRGHLYE